MKPYLLVLIVLFFVGCNNDTKEDGLILKDENTGKEYLLKHNIGDSYFIFEKVKQINGSDTTYVFK